MDIAQTTPATAGSAAPAAAKPRITSDFDTFLQMLTAQMKNQDPLNPIESADFATQLATFSSVEQAVLTNDLLRGLMSQTGLADMAGWVGKEARAAAPVYFDGTTPMTLHPQPMAGAETGEIVVRDETGGIVHRFAAPASGDPLPWTGALPTGVQLPAGVYQFTYISSREGKSIGDTGVEIYAQVAEVRSVDGEKQLITKGGVAVPVKDVTALRDAP
ncbi:MULTISPECIES: flagellar hook capping FlgD N-terminal domain-containing protein [unclassified Yoonia]|uniref:flagellar hook capping FlgD N-terminal domain-containing protein n=1 Tax=unclassified Yoonia TaxID=2629118 RepID=UPI002AFE29E0|nr:MULTISPECIES: flagellar hook capping FlgD N-terminal domain-containing protein [unclassified Yoonia]